MSPYILGAVAENLEILGKLLSDDDCKITATELLESITGRSISEEDAGEVKRNLRT